MCDLSMCRHHLQRMSGGGVGVEIPKPDASLIEDDVDSLFYSLL
jgi:hypothetical protein